MINLIAGIITIIEFVTLVAWLAVATGTPVPGYGPLDIPAGLAAAVLAVGITIEELVRYRLVKGRFPRGGELGFFAGGIAVEIVGWIIALRLADPQAIIGSFGVLFGTLAVEHALIQQATNGGPFNLRGVLDFSAVEAVGGAVWLVNPSVGTLVILAVTSALEHVQGVRQALGLR